MKKFLLFVILILVLIIGFLVGANHMSQALSCPILVILGAVFTTLVKEDDL